MLSVVIAARDAAEQIVPCLAALEAQARTDVEVLVADASRDGTAEVVERAFPWARLVRGDVGSGLAELRAAGLARARGRIVAFTDVYCRVSPDWVARLLGQPWATCAAVGGVVVPERRTRPAEWAAFLCEYAPHLPPAPAGGTTLLPGNNVAFRRDALERAGLVGGRQFWKVFALWRLASLGERFRADPGLVVHHYRPTPAPEFAHQRYLHGRCFGANRVRQERPARRRWVRRLARAASCPAVPLLLTARLVAAVHGNRRYRRALWRSLPYAVLFNVAWGWGELDGYLRGAGDACARLT